MSAPLGLIAGLGDLPVAIAEDAVGRGQGVFVLRLRGFEEPRLADYPGAVVGLGEFGAVISQLKTAGCKDITFAGIVRRPDFKNLRLDMKGAALLPKVIAAARRGDDALLTVLVNAFEKHGFSVKGTNEVRQDLVMSTGAITKASPDELARADIEVASRVAGAIGNLDVGQACIVCDGLVLAVEAQEGTDQMLRRCASLPAEIRGSMEDPRGILLKRPKPSQERRIDLPTAGLSTVDLAIEAGLAGIALEAEGALLIDRAAMIERADSAGIFIYGFTPEEGE